MVITKLFFNLPVDYFGLCSQICRNVFDHVHARNILTYSDQLQRAKVNCYVIVVAGIEDPHLDITIISLGYGNFYLKDLCRVQEEDIISTDQGSDDHAFDLISLGLYKGQLNLMFECCHVLDLTGLPSVADRAIVSCPLTISFP